ncbi:hypothetical protein [uncultured Phenylobacterium sp.]|uniref:hypothetical protein n=1 Tax=uncultured Phenylobacterium sp. TaxID=349273 RepID=UPI0025EA2056|nr:hypothetical protein [uncultured Phenylobacterium sp.]
MTTFPHPLDGLPVRRTFTAQTQALFPSAILMDPAHPWLQRQERSLPRGTLGVIYHRDGVELVTPQGILRRPFVGAMELGETPESAPASDPAIRSAKQMAAAERTRAWKAANPSRVQAQHRRQAQRRKTERHQLYEAAAATNRAA